MSDITGLVTGLSNSLNQYLGKTIENQQDTQKYQAQKDIDVQADLAKKKGEMALQGADQPDAGITPDMAEKLLPGAGANLINGFQKQNGRFPTMKEGTDYLKTAMDSLQPPDTSKQDNHQDQLEKQAMDRITTVRGDQSLMRKEHQRDAAGMAYDTVAKAESENRPLTELEQNDLIGQLWQARAGKAPTDNDMKLMNDKIGKRDFNHIVTYITGNPSIVGASTDETLKNLKQFIVSSGSKADEQWQAYMNPRLVKPTGLDDSRWNHIAMTTRGIPFKDQVATSDKTYSNPANRNLKVGDVYKGYRFKGGDKTDPNAWEKAQ